MKYEVTKKQRGDGGKWFSYKACRFATVSQALEYAEEFALQQEGVAGTVIVVTERKGQRLIKEFRVQ